ERCCLGRRHQEHKPTGDRQDEQKTGVLPPGELPEAVEKHVHRGTCGLSGLQSCFSLPASVVLSASLSLSLSLSLSSPSALISLGVSCQIFFRLSFSSVCVSTSFRLVLRKSSQRK